MTKTIIISVGTSIITNHNRNGRYSEYVSRLIKELEETKKLNEIDKTVLDDGKREIVKRLDKCKNKIDSNNISRKTLLDTSAEIHSLYKYYQIPGNIPADGEKDKIILLCTDTPDSLLSAQIIRDEVLTKWKFFKEKCEMESINPIDDVYDSENGIVKILKTDVYHPDEWLNGLRNLHQFFLNEFPNDNNQNNIIFRSGSYKELSAHLLLISLWKKFTSYYVFENSNIGISLYCDNWNEEYENIINSSIQHN